MDQVVWRGFVSKLKLSSNCEHFFEIYQLDSVKKRLYVFSFPQNVWLHFNLIKINLFDFSVFFKAFSIFLNFHRCFIKLYFDEFTLILSDRIQMNVFFFWINWLVATEKPWGVWHVQMVATVKTVNNWISFYWNQVYLILWVQMVTLITVLLQLMVFVVDHILSYLTLFQNVLILDYFLRFFFCPIMNLFFNESIYYYRHICLVNNHIRSDHFFI
jgi:hypothetical protein